MSKTLTNIEASSLNDHLEKALKIKDKQAILKLYDEAREIEWDDVATSIFERYDELVTKCNDLLYN